MCELVWKSLGGPGAHRAARHHKGLWVPRVQESDVLLVNGSALQQRGTAKHLAGRDDAQEHLLALGPEIQILPNHYALC